MLEKPEKHRNRGHVYKPFGNAEGIGYLKPDVAFFDLSMARDGLLCIFFYLTNIRRIKMKRKILSLILALLMAITLLPSQIAIAAEPTLASGQTYYFDLSSQGIPGTVNSALPDDSLKWVPFTYVGEISAYSRQTAGVSTAGTVTASSRTLFIADYNVTTSVSWDTLNKAALVFGKAYAANNADYQLRIPSVGSGSLEPYSSPPTTNEWDTIYQKNNGYIKNYDSIASWGQDSASIATDPSTMMIVRGGTSRPDDVNPANLNTAAASVGFRPVLQANSSELHAITLDLNGGNIGGSLETLQIVVSPNAGSYPAPGKGGLTRPAESSGAYFRWNTQADGTGMDYEPGSYVPISVTTLYAKWAPVEQYSLTTGETYYFDLSGETIPGTVNAGVFLGENRPGLPDTTLHYVPFTYFGTIDAYSLSEERAATQEWAAANISFRSLFMADNIITHTVSWDALNAQNLVFGKEYQYNSILYQLRAPTVGSASEDTYQIALPRSNEWSRILEKGVADIKNDELFSFGQDTWIENSTERGSRKSNFTDRISSDYANLFYGFRPVLQILNSGGLAADGLEAKTLNLGGGSIDTVTGSIKLVAKKGSAYTAPSATGITRPDEGEYFMWKGSDNNLYAPGASVPAGVTSLTAVFQEAAAPAITTATLPDGTVNTAYSQTLAATGDTPITWSIDSGDLPDGLSLSGSTISGTPTAAGTFSFTVKAQNSTGTDTKALSIKIGAAPTITTATLPDGTVNAAYSHALTAEGSKPILWSLTGAAPMPDGLTLSEQGVISGTPTKSGTFSFSVWAENTVGYTIKELSITIRPVGYGEDGLTINVTDSADAVPAGVVQDYTVVVGNEGSAEIQALVSYTRPEQAAGVPASSWKVTRKDGGDVADGWPESGTLSLDEPIAKQQMTLVTLPAGSSVTFTLSVSIRPDAVGELAVSVEAAKQGWMPYTKTAADTNELSKKADLTVTIDDSKTTLAPGQAAPYKVRVTNNGPSNVSGITLSCPLPAGASEASWGPTGYFSGASASPNSGNGALNTTLTLNSGAYYEFWFTVLTPATASGSLTATATVTAPAGIPDPKASDNTATDTNTYANSSNADLKLSMGFSDQTGNGTGEVTFYANVELRSSGNATNVVVSVPLPLGVTFISAAPETGTYDATSGDWSVGTLSKYGDVHLKIKARVDYSAPRTVTASLKSLDQTEDDPSDNSASLVVSQKADLSVTAAADPSAPKAGDTVTITVMLKNDGPGTAEDFAVRATLPAGLAYVSSTPSSGVYIPPDEYFPHGSWYPDPLNTGDTATLQLKAIVTAPGTYPFDTQIQGLEIPDPDTANNSASVTITTAVPAVTAPAITTTTLPDGIVNVPYRQALAADGGTPITWSIESGDLPGGLSLSGSTISGTPTAAGTFAFSVKAQNSKGSDVKELRIVINSVTPVTHTITASAGSGGSISPSGSVSVTAGGSQTFTVIPNSNYSITSVTVDGINQGKISQYTFTNVSGNHTIHVEFQYTGAGSDDDYILRTLTDSATGITASGYISAGAVLTVGNMTLGSDAACNTIRSWINDEDYGLLLGVDISLSGSFNGPLTLTLPVGTQYNGKKVIILHAKREGTLDTYTATVKNGKVTFDVTSLSPFAVFTRDGQDDIPKTRDTSSAWIWWALLAVSGAGIITLVLFKKKAFQKR